MGSEDLMFHRHPVTVEHDPGIHAHSSDTCTSRLEAVMERHRQNDEQVDGGFLKL